MDDELRPYVLYRMYNHDGEALRFGITARSFDDRLREYRNHPEHRLWVASELDSSRTMIETLGTITERDARLIEKQMIGEARPLANDEFNPNGDPKAYFALLRHRALQPESANEPNLAMPLDWVGEFFINRGLQLLLILALVGALIIAFSRQL